MEKSLTISSSIETNDRLNNLCVNDRFLIGSGNYIHLYKIESDSDQLKEIYKSSKLINKTSNLKFNPTQEEEFCSCVHKKKQNKKI